jgi:uncharacterized protein (DUF1778 family)
MGKHREYVGKSSVMNFRITPETKAALVKAAKVADRTLSQETEHRLHRDLFDHGSTRTWAVMRTIAHAVDRLVNLKNPRASWLTDPYLFQQAKLVVTTTFDLFDPGGSLPATVEENLDRGGQMQGRAAVHELLRSIQIADAATPRAKQTAEQRALLVMKSDLNELADLPRPYGKAAAQLRGEAELGPELAPLMRKVKENPDGLTAAENRRFLQLVKRLAELGDGQTKTTETEL